MHLEQIRSFTSSRQASCFSDCGALDILLRSRAGGPWFTRLGVAADVSFFSPLQTRLREYVRRIQIEWSGSGKSVHLEKYG